eukprot:6183689-Pleurochrysis_carterae.AAC.1
MLRVTQRFTTTDWEKAIDCGAQHRQGIEADAGALPVTVPSQPQKGHWQQAAFPARRPAILFTQIIQLFRLNMTLTSHSRWGRAHAILTQGLTTQRKYPYARSLLPTR